MLRRSFLALPIANLAPALAAPKKPVRRKVTPKLVPASKPVAPAKPARPDISRVDDAFLEDLSWRTFRFFLECADPQTGMVRDRALNYAVDEAPPNRWPASIASTGFGLTALCIGADRRWIGAEEARRRILLALSFFANHAAHEHGFFYHFMDPRTGAPTYRSEVSSIDTALLLAGILTARQYFLEDEEIQRLANLIYERVDFTWMLNGDPLLLSHGWRPGAGFIPYRWDAYSEHMILYLLAIGSPTHSIPPDSWYAWRRPEQIYGSYKYITSAGPLFVHQYSHAWIDFRERREGRAPNTNWFINSITATRAHRDFCISLGQQYPSYSADLWGITASDSIKGYRIWGVTNFAIDGTIVPCAPGGSLMFTPDICIPALRNIKEKYGEKLYRRYGFSDAFNPMTGWVDDNVIGIDLGVTLLSVENLRTGHIWSWFMSSPEIPRAMDLVLLRPTTS